MILIIIFLSTLLVSCSSIEYTIDKIGEKVRQHENYNSTILYHIDKLKLDTTYEFRISYHGAIPVLFQFHPNVSNNRQLLDIEKYIFTTDHVHTSYDITISIQYIGRSINDDIF